MTGRRRQALDALIRAWLVVSESICVSGCRGKEPTLHGASWSELAVGVPSAVQAGQPWTVTWNQDGPSEISAWIMHGSYGPLLSRRSRDGEGEASVRVEEVNTRATGVVHLISFGRMLAQSTVEIRPAAAVDPIVPLVGPRSIVADGEHWTMCTVVPLDRFKNVVAEGTRVELSVRHADSSVESFAAPVEHLVAWRRIVSRTTSGRAVVVATAAGKFGPDASFAEVPGPPVPFALVAQPEDAPADGRTVVEWKAGPFEDRFGNTLLDGTYVGMLSTSPPLGYFFSDAVVVGGSAQRLVRAPVSHGISLLESTVLGASLARADYRWSVGPATGSVSVRFELGADELSIIAGPFATASGSYPPDGIDVEFTLQFGTSSTQLKRAQLDSGYARTKIPLVTLGHGLVVGSVRLGEAVAEFGPLP